MRKNIITIVSGIILSFAFLLLFYAFGVPNITQMDQIVITRTPLLTAAMLFFSFISNTTSIILGSLILVIFFTVYKKWEQLKLFLISLLGGELIVWATKLLVHRARPIADA